MKRRVEIRLIGETEEDTVDFAVKVAASVAGLAEVRGLDVTPVIEFPPAKPSTDPFTPDGALDRFTKVIEQLAAARGAGVPSVPPADGGQ